MDRELEHSQGLRKSKERSTLRVCVGRRYPARAHGCQSYAAACQRGWQGIRPSFRPRIARLWALTCRINGGAMASAWQTHRCVILYIKPSLLVERSAGSTFAALMSSRDSPWPKCSRRKTSNWITSTRILADVNRCYNDGGIAEKVTLPSGSAMFSQAKNVNCPRCSRALKVGSSAYGTKSAISSSSLARL